MDKCWNSDSYLCRDCKIILTTPHIYIMKEMFLFFRLSIGVYFISFILPAIDGFAGWKFFLVGPLMISYFPFGTIYFICWLSNISYALSIFTFHKKRNKSELFSLISIVLALSFLLTISIQKTQYNDQGLFGLKLKGDLNLGFWLWFFSFLLIGKCTIKRRKF